MNRFYIDFTTWIIEADSGTEAARKAIELIHTGIVPEISGTEAVMEEDDEYNQPATEGQLWSTYA